MKYVAFWEYDKKDEEALFEKFRTRPESEINRISPPFALGGQTKGFSLLEEDDFERIEKFCHHYKPLLKFKIYPIIEAEKAIKLRKY